MMYLWNNRFFVFLYILKIFEKNSAKNENVLQFIGMWYHVKSLKHS